MHQALLLRQWTDDVIFLTRGEPLSDDQAEQLAARRIRVVDGEVTALEITDDRLVGARMHDGTVIPREAVAVTPRMVARARLLAGLGLRPSPHPMGEYVAADPAGRTDVPGVWVAGNVTDLAAEISASAAAGAVAAARINAELVAEETHRAVQALRDPFSAQNEARVSELVLGDRRHGL